MDVPFAFTKEQSAEAFIRPFDLGKAPLFRAGFVQIEHNLCIESVTAADFSQHTAH
jgi:hypothetical protein